MLGGLCLRLVLLAPRRLLRAPARLMVRLRLGLVLCRRGLLCPRLVVCFRLGLVLCRRGLLCPLVVLHVCVLCFFVGPRFLLLLLPADGVPLGRRVVSLLVVLHFRRLLVRIGLASPEAPVPHVPGS